MDLKIIANTLIEKIKAMKEGDVSSIAILLHNENIELENKDMFELYNIIEDKIKNEKFFLDYSHHNGLFEGLSFNMDFVKRNANPKEHAIRQYVKKFGGFPYFLFLGASDEDIINAIEKSFKENKEITKENNNIDY